ncbi:MAG: AAA family ATPase, partial [Ruthenibacterium sp.]
MFQPLADRLRPQTLGEVCGQQHLLGENQVFRKTVESGRIPNMIFYGPSGVGKTTVARIIAQGSGMRLHRLNGTSAGTADIKTVLSEIGTLQSQNGILLYLDEIQYLNKKQQQSLLECIEDGSVTLIASTTENPYFYIYNALLSRATVFEFKALTPADILQGLHNALVKIEQQDCIKIEAEPAALTLLSTACGGDMRKALGSLEFAVAAAKAQDGAKTLTLAMVQQVAQRSSQHYDK